MADLYNNFPSWGETGQYPVAGFFYEGGDQVNEKHMDALWNGVETHIDNLNTAIRDRVRKLEGNVVLDQGLVTSQGTGTREVDVTASSAGAFVDGQFSGSTSATTLTHTANAGATTRTDVVWVNTNGTVGKSEGTTTTTADRMKLAEVDIATNDTISAVRNYARDHVYNVASENAPATAEPGDLWHDLTALREKVRQNGDWRTIITEQDDLTINAGDGLKTGGTVDLVGGASVTLDIEPADFAGTGLIDDGFDNLALVSDSVTIAGNTVSLGGSTTVAASDLSDYPFDTTDLSFDTATQSELNNHASDPNAHHSQPTFESETHTGSAGRSSIGSSTYTVTFNNTYSTPPSVTVGMTNDVVQGTSWSGEGTEVWIESVTTTGCTVRYVQHDGFDHSVSYEVNVFGVL